jgi:hypothetical protein
MEIVKMRSPDGDVVEVEPTPEALAPLMAKGYVQVVVEVEGDTEVSDAR